MRKVVLPLFAAVALGGCYHYEAPTAGPAGTRDAWYGQNVPLQADIWYSEFSGDISVNVSQPAYTSVFLIRPGAGATMVFPRYGGGENYFREGTHQLNAYYTGFGGYGWRSSLSSLLDPWRMGAFGYGFSRGYPYGNPYGYPYGYGRPYGYGYGYPYGYGFGGYGYYGYGPWASLNLSHPMYLLLVASTEPLRTQEFLAGRQTMGLRFASYSVTQTMHAITDDIVMSPEYANWTTATYVVWPQAPPMPVYAMMYPGYGWPNRNPLVQNDSSTFAAPGPWHPRGPETPGLPGGPGGGFGGHVTLGAPGTATPVPLMPTEPGRLGKPEPMKPQVPSVPVKPVDGKPQTPPPMRRPEGRTPMGAQPRAGVPEVPPRATEPQHATEPPHATEPQPHAAPPPRRPEPSAKPAPSRPAPPPARSSRRSGHSSQPAARPAPRSAPRVAPRAAPQPAPKPAPRPSPPPSHNAPPPGH